MSRTSSSNYSSTLGDAEFSQPSAGVAELLAAGKALGEPIDVAGHQKGVIIPAGFVLTPLPFAERPPLPDHVRQAVTFDDAESFVLYVKRWKRPEMVILAQLPTTAGKGAKFTAIFDYHTGGQGEPEHKAARCAHTAVYPCPLSVEWQLWTAINGQPQSQKKFIDFIEANTPDVVSPSAAELMEMAMNFESKTDVTFQSRVDRVTGGRNLSFKEETEATSGGQIRVPDALHLRLPVFEGGVLLDIRARLEWLPKDGKLQVVVHLQRVTEVMRTALADIRKVIQTGTDVTVLNGEAPVGRE